MRKGYSITLHCSASGYGSLTYYWERRISQNHNWFHLNHSINETLHLALVGQYRCNVTNEAGSVISPVITVYGKDFSACGWFGNSFIPSIQLATVAIGLVLCT